MDGAMIDDSAICKILPRADWAAAPASGVIPYAPVDLRDGYMHLSTGAQVLETARLHFAGARDLVIVEAAPEKLDGALRYEESRGGEKFPHLYGAFPLAAVRAVYALVEQDGAFSVGERLP